MMPMVIQNEESGFCWVHSQFRELLKPASEMLHLHIEEDDGTTYKIMFKDHNLVEHVKRKGDEAESLDINAFGTNFEFHDYISTILFILFHELYPELLTETTPDDRPYMDDLRDIILERGFSWRLIHQLHSIYDEE